MGKRNGQENGTIETNAGKTNFIKTR